MKKSAILFVVFLVFVIVGSISASGPGSSASGSGSINDFRKFTFTAVTNQQGVSGKHTVVYVGPNLVGRVQQGDIDCLNVQGNVAIMSGVITYIDGLDITGDPFWFKVEDNGEGFNAPPDRITWTYQAISLGNWADLGRPANCYDVFPDWRTPLLDVLEGNIQVR